MKKKNILGIGAAGAALLISFNAFTYGNGAPQGRTGSPLSAGETCGISYCHSGGPAVSSQLVKITSDIPSTGFLENTLYNFTITLDDGGTTSSKVGFSSSIEDQFGMVGNITAGSGSKTIGNFLTHTSASTAKPGQSKDYDFTWFSGTASQGTTVYVASNFSNSDNSLAGDVIVSASLPLIKANGISLDENSVAKFQMAPNPANDFVLLTELDKKVNEIDIYSLDGKLQQTFSNESKINSSEWSLNLSNLNKGNYLVLPKGTKNPKAQKLIISK